MDGLHLIVLTENDGRRVRVPAGRIVAIHEAGMSSQWHGTRSIVEVDGRRYPVEARETVQEIERALAARDGEGA